MTRLGSSEIDPLRRSTFPSSAASTRAIENAVDAIIVVNLRCHVSGFFVLSLSISLNVIAQPKDSWKAWERELHRQCPENHVEWIGDSRYDDLLGAFIHTLPSSTQRKITALADYQHRCAKEVGGFSCEMAVHLDAFNRLGLLKRFVAFGCRQYKCDDVALCVHAEPRH